MRMRISRNYIPVILSSENEARVESAGEQSAWGLKALGLVEKPRFAKRDWREVQMVEKVVTCQVSCQLCGWNVGGTITTDESKLLDELLRFWGRCLLQHPSQRPTGKLLVSWEPLEPVTN